MTTCFAINHPSFKAFEMTFGPTKGRNLPDHKSLGYKHPGNSTLDNTPPVILAIQDNSPSIFLPPWTNPFPFFFHPGQLP